MFFPTLHCSALLCSALRSSLSLSLCSPRCVPQYSPLSPPRCLALLWSVRLCACVRSEGSMSERGGKRGVSFLSVRPDLRVQHRFATPSNARASSCFVVLQRQCVSDCRMILGIAICADHAHCSPWPQNPSCVQLTPEASLQQAAGSADLSAADRNARGALASCCTRRAIKAEAGAATPSRQIGSNETPWGRKL